jgi:hypothetical protein
MPLGIHGIPVHSALYNKKQIHHSSSDKESAIIAVYAEGILW